METERRKETVNDAFSHKTMNGSKKQLILNAADVRGEREAVAFGRATSRGAAFGCQRWHPAPSLGGSVRRRMRPRRACLCHLHLSFLFLSPLF